MNAMTTAQKIKAYSLADPTWNKSVTIQDAINNGGVKVELDDGDYKFDFADGSFVYFYEDGRNITAHYKDEY